MNSINSETLPTIQGGLNMAVKKLCNKVNCSKYCVDGHRYCQDHLYIEEEQARRREEYLRDRRPDYSKFSRSPLYNSAQWKKKSKEFLVKNPYCCVCGDYATVVDHIIPHRNDLTLFWDEDNWRPMCKSCHDKKTREEINERNRQKRNNSV